VSGARKIRIGAGVLVLLVAGATWVVVRPSSAPGQAAGSGADKAGGRTATAPVSRRDLIERESVQGTLGYADARSIVASAAGTVTALAGEGSEMRPGQVLYRIDGRPTVLMAGTTPAWRPLSVGIADGVDIRQLERNLAALGYDPDGDMAVDEHFDWATRAAVRRWQKAMGQDETGIVDLGTVAFLPGARRVGSLSVALGAQVAPGTELMQSTSTTRVVTVHLDATKQRLVARGDHVIISLPDGRTTPGTIADVGRVAQVDTDQNGSSSPYIVVTITADRPSATGRLDQAPVDVDIEKDAAPGALAVPVTALLAQAGGGYAVEVVEGGRGRLVPVEVGMFADGYVEVSGTGIAEGTKVVVAE
jgi:peptidoglycan hydrolase-like protein with peptidoglycan-binding domain